MDALRPFHSRHRFLVVYAVAICAAAATLCAVRPAHTGSVLIMTAVTLAGAAVLGEFVCRQFRQRLHRLRDVAEAIRQGDFSQHIEHPPHDDFMKLTDSFEQMLAQLQTTLQEERRLREQLTRSEKLALIGELAATVAHEVNNPLDGLQNSTRIIRRNLDNAEQTRQLLDMMDAGLYRIEMIVRRLLTMSRDEPVTLTPTRIDDVINDATTFIQPRFERYHVTLESELPETPVFVQADREQLAQALINLMINAADSMPDGGILTTRCQAQDDEKQIVLEISDTGSGIEEEHLPHIFDPFYSTKGKGAGTGLGLAVVARIVTAHGGHIDVQSTVGEGTCFKLTLPAVKHPMSHSANSARGVLST